MLPNAQRHGTDLPQPSDRIVELFSVPTAQWCPTGDDSPATPRPPGRWHAALSWLWQFFLDGCTAYAFAFGMYPCFPDPSDPSDLFGLRRAPAEPPTAAPAEPSPWQFVPLGQERGRPMSIYVVEDSTIADIERGNSGHGMVGSREV
jgi:hypothetical protein